MDTNVSLGMDTNVSLGAAMLRGHGGGSMGQRIGGYAATVGAGEWHGGRGD